MALGAVSRMCACGRLAVTAAHAEEDMRKAVAALAHALACAAPAQRCAVP